MFRPPVNSRTSAIAAPNRQSSTNNVSSNESSSTTIREIRSRTFGSTAATSSAAAKHLLANKRQAISMERLNSVTSAHGASNTVSDKDKCSPSNGSSNSINGSIGSSPGRTGGGLNRTASRVSRFRSAKAVFERLSSNNSQSTSTFVGNKVGTADKPRGVVASRYAAAAAARAVVNSSPKSRPPAGSLVRSHDSGRSASNIEIHRTSSNSSLIQPRPQPRIGSTSRVTNHTTSSQTELVNSKTKNAQTSQSTTSSTAKSTVQQVKPPPKDLIDKIVLEIARDASNKVSNANCSIQDLSNCDTSGIPDTLDFDRCFQDVEMMTEEEARKLLSRKSIGTESSSPSAAGTEKDLTSPTKDKSTANDVASDKSLTSPGITLIDSVDITVAEVPDEISIDDASSKVEAIKCETQPPVVFKSKVRFSDDPVKVFNTHAVEDYDRRNDEIDPIAASAEYEIEKFKEREGIRDSDEEDYIEPTDRGKTTQSSSNPDSYVDIPHTPHNDPPHGESHDSSVPANAGHLDEFKDTDGNDTGSSEYIQSLEREISLKRILEQNLRDLQSQYYESVKELDEYKGISEAKVTGLEKNVDELKLKLENLRNELSDVQEHSAQLEKDRNDIKESSQVLEKKYHRAKRIIKDMQSREQSYNRREQLYQQKLDEIEFELGLLIESIDKTIYDDAIKFFSLTDPVVCQQQHQVRLDVFGLLKQILNKFSSYQTTQNAQIKQRVVSILEQQLANLMVTSNETTSATATQDLVVSSSIPETTARSNPMSDNESVRFGHNDVPFASHRLSQPNLPHPIGVGGQPMKFFHGLAPLPIPVNASEPSPPQSVNSYPSSNSLNSLHNNNNNTSNLNNNNTTLMPIKLREQQPPSITELQRNSVTGPEASLASSISDEKFKPVPDIQVPYQTNEWHDKPVSEWTTTQVSTWLLALGLDQYISKFEDRNVNGQSLINLDSTVLKGLGVLNSNDRNLLKKKIRELRAELEKERKLVEKRLKESLKDKSKSTKIIGTLKTDTKTEGNPNKSSWKKGLLS